MNKHAKYCIVVLLLWRSDKLACLLMGWHGYDKEKETILYYLKCKLTWTRRNELSYLIRIRGSIELLFLFIYLESQCENFKIIHLREMQEWVHFVEGNNLLKCITLMTGSSVICKVSNKDYMLARLKHQINARGGGLGFGDCIDGVWVLGFA